MKERTQWSIIFPIQLLTIVLIMYPIFRLVKNYEFKFITSIMIAVICVVGIYGILLAEVVLFRILYARFVIMDTKYEHGQSYLIAINKFQLKCGGKLIITPLKLIKIKDGVYLLEGHADVEEFGLNNEYPTSKSFQKYYPNIQKSYVKIDGKSAIIYSYIMD